MPKLHGLQIPGNEYSITPSWSAVQPHSNYGRILELRLVLQILPTDVTMLQFGWVFRCQDKSIRRARDLLGETPVKAKRGHHSCRSNPPEEEKEENKVGLAESKPATLRKLWPSPQESLSQSQASEESRVSQEGMALSLPPSKLGWEQSVGRMASEHKQWRN